MKNFSILLICFLFMSCYANKYFINGAGIRERDWGPDDSISNSFRVRPEYQHTERGYRYYYYELSGRSYRWQNESVWRVKREWLYDYYLKKAEENGYNPHWWIDRHLKEGEGNSS